MRVAIPHGAVLASRYEIGEPLGEGGMSTVYAAFDRVRKLPVALKVLRPDLGALPDMERRFASEIPLASRIRQANVCHIFGCGADGNLRYVVMERVDGEDLTALLNRVGALPVAEAFDIAIQICRGAQALHLAGLVHRDIKPKNIMRGTDGRVRLMDFDIARHCRTRDSTDDLIFGTPEYASPEQICGGAADFRADIYSIGIVIFELFTGRVPFRGATSVQTVEMHVHKPPPLDGPDAPALPPALVPILRKALAKDPARRYTAVRGLLEALRAAQAATGIVEAKGPSPRRPHADHTHSTPLRRPAERPTLAQGVPALLGALNDKDRTVRWSAVVEKSPLDEQSRSAIRALLTTLAGEEPPAVPDGIDALLQALREGETTARARAAIALGEAGAAARRAIPILLNALEDTDDTVRRNAVTALVKIARAGEPRAAS